MVKPVKGLLAELGAQCLTYNHRFIPIFMNDETVASTLLMNYLVFTSFNMICVDAPVENPSFDMSFSKRFTFVK